MWSTCLPSRMSFLRTPLNSVRKSVTYSFALTAGMSGQVGKSARTEGVVDHAAVVVHERDAREHAVLAICAHTDHLAVQRDILGKPAPVSRAQGEHALAGGVGQDQCGLRLLQLLLGHAVEPDLLCVRRRGWRIFGRERLPMSTRASEQTALSRFQFEEICAAIQSVVSHSKMRARLMVRRYVFRGCGQAEREQPGA